MNAIFATYTLTSGLDALIATYNYVKNNTTGLTNYSTTSTNDTNYVSKTSSSTQTLATTTLALTSATSITSGTGLANIFVANTGSTNILTGTTGTITVGNSAGTINLDALTINHLNCTTFRVGSVATTNRIVYCDATNVILGGNAKAAGNGVSIGYNTGGVCGGQTLCLGYEAGKNQNHASNCQDNILIGFRAGADGFVNVTNTGHQTVIGSATTTDCYLAGALHATGTYITGIPLASVTNAANDTLVVHNTGAEPIAGVKTFSSAPVMSGASITTNTIPLACVTGAAADSAVVHNTDTETIAGVKTFSSAPVMSGASITTNTLPIACINEYSDTNDLFVAIGPTYSSSTGSASQMGFQLVVIGGVKTLSWRGSGSITQTNTSSWVYDISTNIADFNPGYPYEYIVKVKSGGLNVPGLLTFYFASGVYGVSFYSDINASGFIPGNCSIPPGSVSFS